MKKKFQIKSCSDFHFLQKTQWAHMSIFPQSRARWLKRLPCLKYYNVWKWENRLTLVLNAAKNTVICKKVSNKSSWDFNFLIKTPSGRTCLSPPSVQPGCSNDSHV